MNVDSTLLHISMSCSRSLSFGWCRTSPYVHLKYLVQFFLNVCCLNYTNKNSTPANLFSSFCWAPLSTRWFRVSYVHAGIILQIGILIGYLNSMLRNHITSTIWPFWLQMFFALKFYLVQYRTRLPFVIYSKGCYLQRLTTQFVVYQLLQRTNQTIVIHCDPHVCPTNISYPSLCTSISKTELTLQRINIAIAWRQITPRNSNKW